MWDSRCLHNVILKQEFYIYMFDDLIWFSTETFHHQMKGTSGSKNVMRMSQTKY